MSPTTARAELVVEGKNDQHVIWALCKYHKVEESFSVEIPDIDKDRSANKDALIRSIPTRLKQPGTLRALGIVLDADDSLERSWQSVRDKLTVRGYKTVPLQPSPEGTIIKQSGLPKVGVWIMPDNQVPGILEDFIAHLIPEEDKLRSYAENVLSEIEHENLHKYREVAKPKALIHTWLAWQENPGQPLGLAITAQSLQADSPIAQKFVKWLNELFNS